MCIVSNEAIHIVVFDKMLRKYIKESFFNPILHVLPVVLFLVVEDLYGLEKAWTFSFPVVLILAGYVFITYKSIFRWYLISVSVYFLVGIIVTYLHFKNIPMPYHMVIGELVALSFLLFLLVFRKIIQRMVVSFSNKKLSMENNMDELIGTTNAFAVIFAVFSLSYVSVYLFTNEMRASSLEFVYEAYVALIIVISVYESVRVFAVRGNLLKEEWLPIVNEYGQEIGSINHQTSLSNEQKKYIHPVVRIIIIEGNRIFLRKNSCKEDSNPDHWDNAVYSHIKLKESVSECVKRAASERYGSININPVFLANYQIENSCEHQYVHLFLACRFSDDMTALDENCQVKWWTIQQINEELDSGIFTENFLKEYELLMRSGLIDTGRCSCECKLRDEIDEKRTS